MNFKRTEDTSTEPDLRALFSMEPDEELQPCIPVCAGEWRQDGEVWRFYIDTDWEA